MTFDDTETAPLGTCSFCPQAAAALVDDDPACDIHARILDHGELGGEA